MSTDYVRTRLHDRAPYNPYPSIYYRDECNISNINDNKTFAVAQDKERGIVLSLIECKRASGCNAPWYLGIATVSGVQHCDCINLMEVRGHHVGVHPSFV